MDPIMRVRRRAAWPAAATQSPTGGPIAARARRPLHQWEAASSVAATRLPPGGSTAARADVQTPPRSDCVW
eukprot:207359-Prorocentrum_minimum.AAC.2